MKNNEIIQPAEDRTEYTLQMLLDDIQEIPIENEKDSQALDETERERQHKLIIAQMIIYMAATYNSPDYDQDEKLLNAIEYVVNRDEQLSGYLFYVSENPQFDYSWNYMRKRKKDYVEFLARAVRFLNNVVADINVIAECPLGGKDIHVEFNGLIDIAFSKNVPHVKASVLWNNLNRITKVKKDYNVSVKSKDTVLYAGQRKNNADAKVFFEKAIDIAKRTESETEKVKQ